MLLYPSQLHSVWQVSVWIYIKVLSSGYKLNVLSGYEVLITLTVTIWLQRQMVFRNVIILSSNDIDYYYFATNVFFEMWSYVHIIDNRQ